MTPTEIVLLVAGVLDELGAPYVLVGSLASSAHGIPRSTNDADLVVQLEPRHVPALVARLSVSFYLDQAAADRAIASGRSFNAIHLDTGFKVDMFVPAAGAFGHQQLARRVREAADPQVPERTLCVATAEDVLLAKLLWYRSGGMISDRQWQDVVGLIRVQGPSLDVGYLQTWARQLGVDDLLRQALAEGRA